MALVLWNAPAFARNVITPDGRTQTNVSVSGATTTITTQTVSGNAGYNSFSRFEQAGGTTVNMHLPQNTGALVNIVRNGPVVVNGILNSYKNGQIGGHVYFSDSAGFTVGPSGVINTGQLTVNTPTRDFLEQVIGPNGVVNETMAARLRANDIPISPDGAISIEGRINAKRGVTLYGSSVSVAGQITANAAPIDIGERRRRHQNAFAASVNTSGIRHGGAMVARRGGGIEIVAAGTASISGSLSANATARRSAGSIVVRSGRGTTITQTARLSAQGAAPSARLAQGSATSGQAAVNTGDGGKISITSDAAISIARGARFEASAAQGVAGKGGEIKVFAGTNLDVESGAIFRGKGGLTGDGGFTELSATKTVTLGAVDVDLSSRSGKAGLLYIDPTDLIIGTGGSASMITNGTDVSLQATNSITIAADGVIDTRQFNRSANGGVLSAANPSTGNSGSILLTSPNISVFGSLLAGVSTGSAYTAGDVTLDATTSDIRIAGMASATSTIDIHGTITGRDISLKADATAVASYVDPSAGPLLALAAQSVGGILFGLNGGYVGSQVLSRIRVVDDATIEATRDVSITAKARQEASLPAITLSGGNPFAAAVSIGEIMGTVTADVASGATIKVGRNLTVNAENDVKLAVSAISISVGTGLVAATVAYGYVDVTTAAKVHSGATVTAGATSGFGTVSVTAKNTNSFSTSSTAVAASGGVAGIAVAYSEYKAEADALLGASLGTSADKVQNVTVQALSDTTKNATSSSTTVGDNTLFNAGPAGSTVSTLLSQLLGKLSTAGSTVPVRVGSALTIADSNLSAKAAIAADPGGTAPTIHASGNVVVAARQRDFGLRLLADSSTNSNSTDPSSTNPEAEISLSFGIAVGSFKHDATATVGSGVTINASRIGVAALNEIPISNTWTNWSGLGEVFSHLNGNLGIVNNILTSYANASSSSTDLGLAGAIDYFRVSNNTSAYVASGATLNQTTGIGAWSTDLASNYVQNWSQGVSIVADTDQHSIDVGGNFGFSGGVNGGTGSAAGGGLLDIGRSSKTVAAVAAGATITATDLSVTANTSDKMFVIATTSGRSSGSIVLSGMVSLSGIQNQTLASISNAASVTANTVSVKADQFVSVFALSGALVLGGGNGVGISVAVLDAGSVTRAYVGDNSDDLSDDRLAGIAPQGLITTGSIAVEAATTGRITAASVAAAVADGTVAITLPPGTSKVVRDAMASFAKTSSSGPSLSASGTAAVALTTMGTSAWIDGARLQKKDNAGLKTSVRALNSTIIEVGSGAAAANLAGTSGASGAIAGAVAIGVLDNSTDARIGGSTLTGVRDTDVQAIAGGRATIVGVGLAVSAGGNGAAAISAAVGLVTNRVSALIANSAITGDSTTSVSKIASVNAYQTTDIGIGGGSAYLGAQSGVGLSLSYASIGDPSGEDAVSATIRNSSLVNLNGLNVVASNSSRIASGAITVGLGGNGLSGAFVFNNVKTSTKAQISGTAGAPPTITIGGDVVVTADSSRDVTFNAIIAGRQTFAQADQAQVDFSGSAANGGDPNPNGAAIVAVTGSAQVGRNNVGISLLSNEVAQSHIATIDDVILTATGDVSVRAQDGASITGVAIGLGGASGQFAGVASVALQSVDNVVRAGITGTGTIITARDILLNGSTTATIRGTAGSLGLGFGSAAVGLSVVENSIENSVSSTIEDARLRASRDLLVQSQSAGTISTLSIGIAISRQVGLAGSVATSSVATDVAATVKRADIIAENNVGVIATNRDGIAVSAGALGAAGGSPSVAGGLSIVSNTIGGSTIASISESSSVDARVNGTGSLSFASGAVVSPPSLSSPTGPSTSLPDLAMAQRSLRGLAVIATSQQAVMANAVTAGIAVYPISGAVGYVTIRNSLGGTTSATIDGSTIDTRLNGGQNPTAIVVDAASHSYAGSYIVVGAIGGAAGAGADAQTTLKRQTSAALTNSTTGTIATSQAGLGGVGAVEVAAVSSQASTGKTIGFSAGVAGAAATGLVNSFEAVTTANIDQGILNAASLRVTADSVNGFYGVAGVGSGGGVALGSAFVVARSQSTTLATIGGGANVTTLNLNGRLDVLATSTNSFTALAAGGSAAGLVGIAGMVNLIDVANTTRAGLYGVVSRQAPTPIQSLAGQSIDGSLNVIARETTTITPETGVAAIGGAGVGLGSATNVASLDSSVLADLSGSTVSTTGAVVVQAVSDRSVDANAFTIGQGGSIGLGAAVNVISVGTGAPAGADLNINGDGTLSRVNQLTAVDPGFTLSTSGLATYRTLRGAYASGATDDQLRTTANAEYLALIQNGTVVNGVLTLTASGVQALRSNAAIALFVPTATDQQVRDYAAARYTALQAAKLQYVIGDAGLNSYRQVLEVATPNLTDAQVKIAADAAYATLLANGVPVNGLYSLRGSSAAVYQAAADAELGRTATFSEVSAYAASQYAWFTSNRARTATPSAISATALLDSSGAQTGATALGGSITASSVSVTSTSKTSTENTALGIGVGGIGVGAALGYTTVADNVGARLDQATVTTGSITVNASAIDGAGGVASRIDVKAGAGSGTASAGAAVAQGAVSNTITARLGGTLTVTGATTVGTSATQGSRADALGAAAAGGGALGISIAKSSLDGTATSNVAANTTLSGGTSLTVDASSAGISYASATAGAGGLLVAGTGADARASDSSRVEAHLGDNASVNVGTGAIRVTATATPDAKAAAYGVSVTGGLAVGAAISRATTNQTVIAAMDGGAAAQRALTAGSLSILATSTIFGTPVTSIGGSPGATSTFSRGGTGAAAWSFSGSGSYYASAVGSDAQAVNTSTVTASAGNNVRLPAGTVAINATNTTRQIASATGFSIAGKYSIGAVLAKASSTATTSATLGDDARLLGNSATSFSLIAAGSDTQIASATSGSGGLISGAGASADTANTATVTASIGARTQIGANTILVNASHTDQYANRVDATQAAALGASASLASHDATSHVKVDIGASAIFVALGNGTNGCYVTTCVQGIELESRNIFTQLALGDTISAGAGGGINGVGAKSTTDVDGWSKVVIGDNANFTSGGSAVSSPGPIAIQAITELNANDTVTLTTGGALQGAGVTSQYRARDVDNEVTLGTGVTLTSSGTINIGTYTTATVKTNALVTTYGLAAVGVAEADTDIITNQTVTIGANSTLTGLDNVNITAGRDASGLFMTSILGDATAIGYVRGVIAVPDADASTDLQNRAQLNVNTGAALLSAQNVTLGAYNGIVTPNADGAGHGFQLYFIPVTQRDESPGASATSTVVMNGRAVGGVFHEQEIIIGCGTGGLSICDLGATPTVYVKAGGAPVVVSRDDAFDAVAYVRANYTTTNGTIDDTAVADTLVGGISSGLVRAYRISQLYAAGGNVFVNGDTIQGNGSLTANGGPTIKVVNNSAAYLILDAGAYIPDLSTGQILFTGAAQGQAGLTQTRFNANGTASVIINNAYTRDDIGGYGPALMIAGDISNLGGLVSINNTQGSFGFSGQRIDSLQFNVTVPNGAVAISSNGPNGMYNAGASPQAEWNHAITYPGATPGAASQSYVINDTINAIGNTLYFGSGGSLNYNLYHRIEDGGDPGMRYSTILYGNCIGYGATGYNCQGGYDFGNGIYFAQIPVVPKYYQPNVQAQGGGTQIYGAQVAIKATIINVNASIEAGRVTNQSVVLGDNLIQALGFAIFNYNTYGYGAPVVDLTNDTRLINYGSAAGSYSVLNSGDKLIPVSYDIRTGQLNISDVNASSGGGSVLLDGQIISTNALGRIKINGGFGHVDIVNNSGLELVTNRINTGTASGANASTSKITIVDRLIQNGPNTTVYAYTPGSGIAIYKTVNGAQPILSGVGATTPFSFIAGDSTSYNPVAGTRYEWTQQLWVHKDGLTINDPNAQGVWRYSSGSSNNPWQFVAAPATGIWGDGTSSGPDYWNVTSTAQGRLTNNQYYYISDPVFFETLQGGVTTLANAMQGYEHCNGGNPSLCSRDFRQVPGSTANTYWNYNYVIDAWLQVTASVKADNPFAVSFAGNASGLVTITSNTSIRQQGNIINPSGATTITASVGSFTQAPNVSILSNHLTLTGRDSVGTVAAPIQATLTAGAAVAAYSGAGGINLNIDSDAKIWRLNADLDAASGRYGDINLRATGGLEVASWADPNYTHLLGNNITISSRNGAVGGINTPLRMQAMATTLANGSQTGGVVNISAQGDIGIKQLSGNLRVGLIASTGGNVRVDVAAGTLKAANAQTAAQSLSTEQLSTIKSKLKLTQADGADAAALASVAVFERNVTQTYTLYSSLIRNGSVTNGVFTLDAAATALYQPLADAAGMSVPAYVADRYASYASVFEKAYGANWNTLARFQENTLESNFSFTTASPGAVSGLASSITANAVWQTGQLVAAIDQAALQPASGVVGNGTAIIVGRDVSLNIGGSIGSLAPDVSVGLDTIRNGTLTTSQLQALAVATTPGSVKLFGTNGSGQRVAVSDIHAVPIGVTLTSVDISQTAPLFISATGTFSGTAQGDIYVQATTGAQSGGGSLNLGRVTATGAINLQAPQGITVATAPNSTTPLNAVQIQAGTDLILTGAGGGIGSAAMPLTYQIGGRLVSASAGAGDAYLVAAAGNAQIGRIFASGTASLTAVSGSIQSYLPGVAISASTIVLNASANVGSAVTPFAVQAAGDGEVSGQIGGSATLSTPTLASQSAVALRIGALTANAGLSLAADAEVRILRSLSATTGPLSITAGAISMATGATVQSGGRITLTSLSDVTLGRVTSTLIAPAGTASIAVSAAGTIAGNGDSVVNLGAGQAGGVIALNAGSGIGSSLAPVSFDAPSLSASSLQGGVYLKTATTARVTALTADTGPAGLLAAGNLTVDALTSGGAASVTSTAGMLTIGTLSSGGATTLSAANALGVTSATTTAGDLALVSTSGGINATTLHSAGAATLTAPGAITVATLTSGGGTNATSSSSTLAVTTLTAGGSSTLAASGTVTLGSAQTTTGDILASSTNAAITAATLNAARNAILTATGGISVTTSLTTGGTASVTSSAGSLDLAAVTSGGSATLNGATAVTLGSARTTAGDLSVSSINAGITATTLETAGAASLTAPGAITVTTLTSSGSTSAASSGGTLDITTLTADATTALSASGAVTIGSAQITSGDLFVTSTTAGITAATLDVARNATLIAAGTISITTSLTTGGTASVTSSAGALDLAAMTSAGSATLSGATVVTLGTVRTTAGDLAVSSATAGIIATTLDAADAATLTAPGAITVATLTSGSGTSATSSGGTLGITTLTAGGTATLAAFGAVTLGSAQTTAGDLFISSTNAGIAAATLAVARNATLTATGAISVTTSFTTGGTASVTSSGGALDLAALTSGGTATLSGATTVTLGTARTTAGDLSVSSTTGTIAATTLDAAGAATLTAPGAIRVTTLTSGNGTSANSSGGTLGITTLTAGGTTALAASGAVTLGTARTTAGDLAVSSANAGITATTLAAAGAATLTAPGAITVATLTSGDATNATSSGSTIDITTLTAAGETALAAHDAVTLGRVETSSGAIRVTSSHAGISAATLVSAAGQDLAAFGDISGTTLTSDGQASIHSTTGRLTIATLNAGATATLQAAGAIALGTATTTAGDLLATSTGGRLTATTIQAFGSTTLSAATLRIDTVASGGDATATTQLGALEIGSLTSGGVTHLDAAGALIVSNLSAGGAATLSSRNATIDLATATTGDTARLSAAGAINLGTLTTRAGDIVATSLTAGITATSLEAAGAIALDAAGAIVVQTASSGSGTSVSTRAGLTIGTLATGGDATLSAANMLTLTSVTSSGNLSLRSTADGITAATLRADGRADLVAAGTVTINDLRSGGATAVSGNIIALTALTAGESANVNGRGGVTLGSVLTQSGDLSVASEFGTIRAGTLNASAALLLQAPGAITVGIARSAGSVTATSSGAGIDIQTLVAHDDVTLTAAEALRFESLTAGGSLLLNSTRAGVTITTAQAGEDIAISGQAIRFGALDAGRSASLDSAGDIDGDSIVATDALLARAGLGGSGSIRLGVGAARNAEFSAPDDVRLGRFGAGDSITILGTDIASSIVQLPGGSGAPLVLDIAGLRERTARSAALTIDALRFRANRIEVTDAAITTSASRFDLAANFVPGALRLTTPGMTVLANNRSIAPVRGFDVQLYQKDRTFFISVNGNQLSSNAYIVRFDSTIANVDTADGVSLVRDMARLGVIAPAGPSFGDIARGFVLGADGRWRSTDPETTASLSEGSGPRVNLGQFGSDGAQP
ncbi:hypothetical protein BHK69_17835 [Bosea vaviloviae]|uniref:Filamentous haemagglutinin FhaB/tRNA nuclease CdiA-like TPS domain-containing protein n=2 Tax=Bosea vaviloviae TaxID=1526658 RepID=A0A1D7U3V1_9HYPH|nr:hypothetical protein BHK69_17835 [Bosea vaviloviae]